ncbi:translation initiation factor [Kushneria aurantia]|uniref:Translation initiation factor n=1 Tax=Kushneria aurantia TaxID=504092 RepID=A0ABV6G5U6_9GAMM|nr:translation initiation factor [Kushneria aurantia]
MSSLRDQLSRQVYSTDQGDLRQSDKEEAQQNRDEERLAALDGVVRVRRETAGRKGKGVTTVQGVPLAEAELKTLAQALKKRCGSGGALKAGVIEIQGDHRDSVRTELEKRGFTVRMAGG